MRDKNIAGLIVAVAIGALAGIDTSRRSIAKEKPPRPSDEIALRKSKAEKKRERKARTRLRVRGE